MKIKKGVPLFLIILCCLLLFSPLLSAECDNAKNTVTSSITSPQGIATTDFNHDGYPDVVIADSSLNDVLVYYNNGGGSFPYVSQVDSNIGGVKSVSVGDFDQDGYDDIVACGQTSNLCRIYYNEGNLSYSVFSLDTGINAPRDVQVGQLVGDSDLDIVVAIYSDNQIKVYEGRAFTDVITISMTLPTNIKLGDIDSDGDLDILAVSEIDSTVKWFENDGAGGFQERSITDSFYYVADGCIADLNNDGLIDIGVTGYNRTTWYSNNGVEQFSEWNLSFAHNYSSSIVCDDLNNDGFTDMVVSDFFPTDEADITYYKSLGSGYYSPSGWERVAISTTEGHPNHLALDDLNNDGQLDIISSDEGDSKVYWWNSYKCLDIALTTFACGGTHSLFCDNFDYDTPLATTNGWTLLINYYSDLEATPTNNELLMSSIDQWDLTRNLHPTPVHYQTHENVIVKASDVYPVVTHEFEVVEGNDSALVYEVADKNFKLAVSVWLNDTQVFYRNSSEEWVSLGYATENISTVKIVQYLGQDTINLKYSQGIEVPLNSTITNSYYDIIINGDKIGSDILYQDVESYSVSNIGIQKPLAYNQYIIDDLYIYRGFDRNKNTEGPYIVQLEQNATDYYVFLPSGVGEPCEDNSDCQTLFCRSGYCAKKTGGMGCSVNSGCLSNNCVRGSCTRASTWQTIDQTKTELSGNDTQTNNLIALLIMLGVLVALIYFTHGHKSGIIAGTVLFNVLGLFFTIVGWLSAWIIFVVFIVEVLVGFILYISMGGSN